MNASPLLKSKLLAAQRSVLVVSFLAAFVNASAQTVLASEIGGTKFGVPAAQEPAQRSIAQLIPTLPWLDALQLNNIILQANESHPSVRAKRSEVKVADAGISAAEWQQYPTPSVVTELDKKGKLGTTLRLQQPIWSAGRIDADITAQKIYKNSAIAGVAELQFNNTNKLIDAYNAFVNAQGRAVVQTQANERLNGFAQMMARRVKEGVSPELDANLILGRLIQGRIDLQATVQSQLASQVKLAQWQGLVYGQDTQLANALINEYPLLYRQYTQFLSEQAGVLGGTYAAKSTLPLPMIQAALDKHPSIIRMNLDIASSEQEVVRKQAEQYPTLYAKLDYLTGGSYSSAVSNRANAYLGFQYTPGAGLQSNSHIASAQAKVETIHAQREQLKLDLAERIHTDWVEYTLLLARLESTQQVILNNETVLDSYTRLFITAKRTWLDVLNADRDLTQSQISLVDLISSITLYTVKLKLNLGLLALNTYRTQPLTGASGPLGGGAGSVFSVVPAPLTMPTKVLEDMKTGPAVNPPLAITPSLLADPIVNHPIKTDAN